MTNISEILKDCPKGTKLYCTLIGDCEFSKLDERGILIKYSDIYIRLTPEGKYLDSGELVLFPSKENRDWSIFNYANRFKKGDFIYKSGFICIYYGIDENKAVQFFAFIPNDWHFGMNKVYYDVIPTEKPKIGIGYINNETRLATEAEKNLLLSAIEYKGYVWDAEKLELRKKELKLKMFDKVLVRDFQNEFWKFAQYGFKVEDNLDRKYNTIGGNWWKYCIPYEGNEHLLGTKENCE